MKKKQDKIKINNLFILNKYLKTIIKVMLFIIKFIIIVKYKNQLILKNNELNNNYFNIQKNLNLSFNNMLKNNIKIGIYIYNLKNGGTQRITSILLNYFYKIKIFDLFVFTQKKKEKNEYIIPNKIKRIVIKDCLMKYLVKEIYKNKINILIYQFPNYIGINILNNLKKVKIIFYQHYCFLYWIYFNYFMFINIYKSLQNSKYIISIIHLENDFIFKKWGINSILMNNFITYDYNNIIPSDLSSKTILMIGRGQDKLKRYELGIMAMEYIRKEIPECQMKIISNLTNIEPFKILVDNIDLEYNVKFVEYTSTPETYFKNVSLHIFPSISESFGLVLSETKNYGIPNILLGLDYVSISDRGTINIYDDSPESISKEAIKILKNNDYKLELGKDSKKSMRKFNNQLLLKNWIKLILCIYNGDEYYQNLRMNDKKISKKYILKIVENQLNLLKRRTNLNIQINEIINFSYLENNILTNKSLNIFYL